MSCTAFLLLLWTFQAVTDLYCVNGGTVTTHNQTGLLGPNQVEIRCQFTIGTGESFDGLELLRKRSDASLYTRVTSYRRPNETRYFDNSLITRTTLSLQENATSLTFNVVECSDEAVYQCQLQVVVGQVVTTVTAEMTLTVNVRPTLRFKNDKNACRLFQENNTLNLECDGEVGKPAGNFVWFAYRKDGQVLDLTSQAVHSPPVPSGCGFRRVSQLSITLSRLDNGLTVRCATNQTTLWNAPTPREPCIVTKCTQTDQISVLFPINQEDVVVSSYPASLQHIVGSTVRLTCTAEGNPAPEFLWKKDGDENINHTTNEWSLNNLQKEDSGTYTCYVSNTVDGKVYNASKSLNFDVDVYCRGVVTTSNQTGLLGHNQVTVRCQFTNGTGERIDGLELHRKRSDESVYTRVTSYRRPNVTRYFDNSLINRTTLSLQEDAANLTFNVVECSDEAVYQCQLQVVVGQVVTTVTAEMTLTVNVETTTPTSLTTVKPNTALKPRLTVLMLLVPSSFWLLSII